jgi:hypothetical protein
MVGLGSHTDCKHTKSKYMNTFLQASVSGASGFAEGDILVDRGEVVDSLSWTVEDR